MISLWNPFVSVKKSEINNIFDSFFDNAYQSMGVSLFKKDENSYSIDIDLPGVKENDIILNLSKDNIVTVNGSRKTKTSSYDVKKSFSLPEDCDADSLTAELKDGVLTLTVSLKKLEESKEVKKIPIVTK